MFFLFTFANYANLLKFTYAKYSKLFIINLCKHKICNGKSNQRNIKKI